MRGLTAIFHVRGHSRLQSPSIIYDRVVSDLCVSSCALSFTDTTQSPVVALTTCPWPFPAPLTTPKSTMARLTVLSCYFVGALALMHPTSASCSVPPPPEPEPIEVVELPLPPVTPDDFPGACTAEINPRGTGCLAQRGGGSSPETDGVINPGDFLPDNIHVISTVIFVGAPAAPDPASVYDGKHVIIIKTNGETFPNGDAWKCLTCGLPEDQRVGISDQRSYPQSFHDGKRILVGDNIIDCGEHDIASSMCTPSNTFIYPIRWETTPEGSSEDTAGGSMREIRIHPDNVHLGFNSFFTANNQLGQRTYYGRLIFNPAPTNGLPLAPRYDLHNVTMLYNPEGTQSVSIEGDKIFLNDDAITIGEFRGFSGTGHEVVYIGTPRESGNTDALAVSLETGTIRRLTSHPEYVDPIDVSKDDEWFVIEDTRATTRHFFLAGMRGVPPVTDMITGHITTGVRNNGPRRFFQPWLLDKYGDRGDYYGQQINGPSNGVPGSGDVNDPEWNALADPKWSRDGTAIVYWQAQTVAPACGDPNPLPCYPSTAEGGRTYRLMMAKLMSREPQEPQPVETGPETIPWGVPYVPGSDSAGPAPPAGEYILQGKNSGFAEVSLMAPANSTAINHVIVVYHDFSDVAGRFINGWENITSSSSSLYVTRLEWYSDMVQTGDDGYLATKQTSEGGFQIEIDIMRNYLNANGTLATTINGVEYVQPQNGT